MSDTEDIDRENELLENIDRMATPPRTTRRTSITIRFSNPQIPSSKRPISNISVDNILVDKTVNILDSNESLLHNVHQTINNVDRVLNHTDHSHKLTF